jgi:PAS domain-containing protein
MKQYWVLKPLNFKKKDMPILKIEAVKIYLNNLKTKRLLSKPGKMKIKATLMGINKSLFFGIGFVLFTSLVLLINWVLNLPVEQTDTLFRQIIGTEQQIHLLKSVHSEYLLHFVKADDFIGQEAGLTKKDVSSLIRTIRLDIDYYNKNHRLSGNKEVAASLSELSSSLDLFESNLNDFMLASLERGDENSGLISRWRQLSTRMLIASSANGPGMVKQMEKIKQLETNYLLYSHPKIIEDIIPIVNEVRSSLSAKEKGIGPDDLDSYTSLTSSLTALDKRIGSANTQGIIGSLDKSLSTLLTSSENAKRLMNSLIVKIRLKWTIARYTVISIFTIACIVLLILITTFGITRPLKSAAGFVEKLASGNLPEDGFVPEGLPEIKEIDHNLIKMVRGLKEKVDLARSLNRNDLNFRLNLCGPQDVLGLELNSLQKQMIDAADLQKKNELENTQRRYINEGLAKFGEILRTRSNDIHGLGDVFIREIVKYLNAIQGGFFLLNETQEENPTLELISAFAYNRKKYLQKSIPLGEGLVGTCAKEKQIINLTEIPEGYISITSGLGDTKPDNLLLVPVLHENVLIGVLEIASLHLYKDHEIQFTREVAGSLGSTIIYARNNQRTSELLAKSQQQAIEMTEQEEEMRQNMEELKATQEESARREEEFRGIAEAIGHSFLMVEYDLDGIIRNANEKFCIFIGSSRDDLIGKTHQEVLKGSLKADVLFWSELNKNSQAILVEKVKIGSKEFLLKEHFASVLNRDGITVQYINFLTELSTSPGLE